MLSETLKFSNCPAIEIEEVNFQEWLKVHLVSFLNVAEELISNSICENAYSDICYGKISEKLSNLLLFKIGPHGLALKQQDWFTVIDDRVIYFLPTA